jgi:hypothetical protein
VDIKCSKQDAASRQLDVAIELLFEGRDPLAVRTLAGAAFTIFSDLVGHRQNAKSWREMIKEDAVAEHGLTMKEAHDILHDAQNSLKHADRTPDTEVTMSDAENDQIIFVATLECGNLGGPLSVVMQAFQIWFFAMYPDVLVRGQDPKLVEIGQSMLGHLDREPRDRQLCSGLKFLRWCEQYAEANPLPKFGFPSLPPESLPDLKKYV